jgi:hypothetical protein
MGSSFYLVLFLSLGLVVGTYTSRRRGAARGILSGVGVSVFGVFGLVAWGVWMYAGARRAATRIP